MIYKEPSENIIGDIVKSLEFPVEIVAVTGPVDGAYEIETCDMYHAQPGFPLTIGGKEYKITDIAPGTNPGCGAATKDKLTVKGPAITVDGFDMYKPFYFHATPIAQGVELFQKNDELKKVPMAWLYEQFTETMKEDPMSTVERTIRFRLFFLTHGSPDKWLTEQAYKEAVRPMHRLAEIFIEKVKSQAWRFDVDDLEYEILNYAKFGVFVSNRGMEKEAWHDKVSGAELSMTLTVFKKDGCDECES